VTKPTVAPNVLHAHPVSLEPEGDQVPGTPSSSLPETDLARIRRWVEKENEKIPPQARDEVRIEIDVDARGEAGATQRMRTRRPRR
jgi:hypothetical protein